VRLIEDVAEGAPLLLCYGPQAGQYVTPARVHMLLEAYRFVCKCPACRGGGDFKTEAPRVGVRCGNEACDGAVVLKDLPPLTTSLRPLTDGWPRSEGCTRCGRKLKRQERQTFVELLLAAAALLQSTTEGMSFTTILPTKESAAHLAQVLQIRRALLHKRNELLGATEDAAADDCAAAGNFPVAAVHCANALRIVEAAYGPSSTATAHQQLKLAAFCNEVGDPRSGVPLMMKAQRTLALYHGEQVAKACLTSGYCD